MGTLCDSMEGGKGLRGYHFLQNRGVMKKLGVIELFHEK